MSEGGLCLLSPVELKAKERVHLHIDVPPHGPVEVESIAWHARRVKGSGAGRKTWAIGMVVADGGQGFQTLLSAVSGAARPLPGLPDTEKAPAFGGRDAAAEDSEEPSPEWDEWSAEWERLFEESEEMVKAAGGAASRDDLHPFRVRIKALSGPRTRTLTLSAASEEQARALAQADLDDSWKILAVERA